MFNLIIDGLNLSLALAAAYHEITGEAAYLTHIQQYDVSSLLITSRFYYLPGYFYPLQKPTLLGVNNK